MSKIPIVIFCGPAGAGKDTAADVLVEWGAVKVALADPIKRFVQRLFAFSNEQLWGPSEKRGAIIEVEFKDHTDVYRTGEEFLKEIRYRGDHPLALLLLVTWYSERVAEAQKRGGLSPRRVLQTFGTEYGRTLSSSIWIDEALRVTWKLLEGGYDYAPESGLRLGPSSGPGRCVAISDGRFANEVLAVRRSGGVAVRLTGGRHVSSKNDPHPSERGLDYIPRGFYDVTVKNTGSVQDLEDQLTALVEHFFVPPTIGGPKEEEVAEVETSNPIDPQRLVQRSGLL